MLVVSPFGRSYTDIAEKLEQSLYCFGGDGGGNGGGDSSQQADMDKEMAAIDAEFEAMNQAYESGQSFTSEGVTTDASDARDSSQDVRYDPVSENYYNFNINRSADYYTDESGRRVYDTLDPQMQDLYEASGQFEALDQMFKSGQASYLTAEGEVISQGEQMDRQIDLIDSQFEALDAVAANPKYAGQQTLLTADGNLYVKDPDLLDQAMTALGEAFANTTIGRLGGIIGGMTGFALSSGPIGANVGYYGGKALASGGLFGALNSKTFEAYSWENPVTGENITEQVFNNPITGETSRQFTTASEFQAQREAEEALRDQYDSGQVQGNVTEFTQAVTGKRKPTWRDYVAGADGNFVDELFSNFTGAGDFANLSEPVRDGIVLAKNLADGQDPLTALVGVFGDDVDEALGLSELASDAIDASFNPETAAWLKENGDDLTALGADIVVYNKDPSQAMVERFGDNILNYLNADTKNERAAGIAGLNIGVALDQGVDLNEALGKGVVDYFRQGGTVDVLLETPELLSNVLPDFDLPNVNIPDLGIDLKATWDELGRLGNELLPAFDFQFKPLIDNFGFELKDFDFTGIDLSKYKPSDFGLEPGEWGQFKDAGINIGDLDLSDYNLPDLADMNLELDIPELDVALRQLGQAPSQIASLEPDADLFGDDLQFEDPEITRLSREILKS